MSNGINEEKPVNAADLARLDNKIDAVGRNLDEKLDRVIEAVYGNGKPGMMTRLALLEQWRGQMDKSMEQLRVMAVGLGITALASLAGLVWNLLTHTVSLSKVP